MERYTKKDAVGKYYIESANGRLESDIFGHIYGEASEEFARLEDSEIADKATCELAKARGLNKLGNAAYSQKQKERGAAKEDSEK